MAIPVPDQNPSENLCAELKRSPQERTEDPETSGEILYWEYSQIPCPIVNCALKLAKEVAQYIKYTK